VGAAQACKEEMNHGDRGGRERHRGICRKYTKAERNAKMVRRLTGRHKGLLRRMANEEMNHGDTGGREMQGGMAAKARRREGTRRVVRRLKIVDVRGRKENLD
jgi:hypothetical protein